MCIKRGEHLRRMNASLAHSPHYAQPDASRLVLQHYTTPTGPHLHTRPRMALDSRALRPELPRLASPLPIKLVAQATPAFQTRSSASSHGHRLSPVEAKTLPSLAPPPTLPARMQRLPSLIRPPSPASAATDERTVRDLAARLALLLHARECCKGSLGYSDAGGKNGMSSERGCLIRNCGVARGVLDHCQECFLPDGKCHVSCTQAKRLLRHFRLCRARGSEAACRLCSALHAEFPWALRHAASLSPLCLRQSAKAEVGTAVRLCRVVSDESECDTRRPTKRRR